MTAHQLIRLLHESEDPDSAPPTDEETQELVDYLSQRRLKPVIVGGAGARQYGGDAWRGRRVGDLDVYVSGRLPSPPPGWELDPEAVGLTSWVSPSGGHVDFMTSGYRFPGGQERVPAHVSADPRFRLPVATLTDLFRMKLNSYRQSDLADLVALARSVGRVPAEAELGKLNQNQRENLELVRLWYQEKPVGAYGE